jgi:hypothetical protein
MEVKIKGGGKWRNGNGSENKEEVEEKKSEGKKTKIGVKE